MNGIERYSKYISITEHVIVGSLALAALNILVQDGVSGVSMYDVTSNLTTCHHHVMIASVLYFT